MKDGSVKIKLSLLLLILLNIGLIFYISIDGTPKKISSPNAPKIEIISLKGNDFKQRNFAIRLSRDGKPLNKSTVLFSAHMERPHLMYADKLPLPKTEKDGVTLIQLDFPMTAVWVINLDTKPKNEDSFHYEFRQSISEKGVSKREEKFAYEILPNKVPQEAKESIITALIVLDIFAFVLLVRRRRKKIGSITEDTST